MIDISIKGNIHKLKIECLFELDYIEEALTLVKISKHSEVGCC